MTTSRAFPAAALWRRPCCSRPSARGPATTAVSVSIDDGGQPSRCERHRDRRSADRPAARAERDGDRDPGRRASALEVARPRELRRRASAARTARDFEVAPVQGGAGGRATSTRSPLDARRRRLSVRGPAGEDWVGYLLIAAPRGAALELSTARTVRSRSRASRAACRRTRRTGRSPPRLAPGEIDVAGAERADPRSRGDGGSCACARENGPIGVALSGAGWNGEGAGRPRRQRPGRASPCPPGYRSGTVVESLGHSPVPVPGRGLRGCPAHLGRRRASGSRSATGPSSCGSRRENGPVVGADAGRRRGDEDDE